jgi:hypothetical protein
MLFDLDDYTNSGVFGDWENIIDLQDNGVIRPNGSIVYGGDMADWATTARATRDAYFKAVNEYFMAARVMRTDKLEEFDSWQMEWYDALKDYGHSAYYFWSAMESIRYLNGRNGGETAFVDNTDYSINAFRPMTQEIYDTYYSKLAILGSLVKDLIELGEDSTISTIYTQ